MTKAQTGHDVAMKALSDATPAAKAANPIAVAILNRVASNYAAGTISDVNPEQFNRALKALSIAGTHRLEFQATEVSALDRSFLTPSMPWKLVHGSRTIATFTAPAAGNVMLTGPDDLVGHGFQTREAARLAVENLSL
jgi:hypothetical protein